jgi:predicted aconitase with swiveling domain
MEAVKPGILTTEFWLALVVPVIAILVIFGVLTPDEGDALVITIGDAIVTVGALLASLPSISAYIKSRAEVKVANGRK